MNAWVSRGVMAHILIVDDEGSIRRLLSQAFTDAGWVVRTAADAPEAIGLCASETFEVVLSDVLMPAMNGHELIRTLATQHATPRFVLMTGFNDVDCDACPLSSRCKVLAKPFRASDAVAFIEGLLSEPPAG